jgi:malate dehydrogenase (oxaloacetate-decarboxylating)(NADP+)
VAKAAMETGVAKFAITDWDAYETQLSKRLGLDNTLTKAIMTKAKKNPKRVVYADAENLTVLKAIQQVIQEKIAYPILLGNRKLIESILEENSISLPEDIDIIDPKESKNETEKARLAEFAELFFDKRKRKGLTKPDAMNFVTRRSYYASLMVETGLADTMVGGLTRN